MRLLFIAFQVQDVGHDDKDVTKEAWIEIVQNIKVESQVRALLHFLFLALL
jgi:hypothetical protein